MKITGLITEYNPFHYGHLYHYNKSKKITNSDTAICIMNGNFTQRGLPAITDKWSRAKMALESGIDIIIELPVVYGIRSANFFAKGAVKLLAFTNLVDEFVFGSESGKIESLIKIAKFLNKNNEAFENEIKNLIHNGYSYPAAREKALKKFFDKKEIISEIKSPNNILGIEYIRAVLENNLELKPLTIKRTSNNYHSTKISGEFASGSALRKLIKNNEIENLKNLVPENSFRILKNELNNNKIPVSKNNLTYPLLAKLRTSSPEKLKNYAEINNGLENRFFKASLESGTYNELINNINTKSITQNRIQRNLLHILFGLTEKEFYKIDQSGPAYLRVLAFNKKGENILAKLKKKSNLPLITKISNHLNEVDLKSSNPVKKQLSYEILADDIYSLLYKNPEFRKGRQDFYQKIIKK